MSIPIAGLNRPENEIANFHKEQAASFREVNRTKIEEALKRLLSQAAVGGVQIEFAHGNHVEQLFLGQNVFVAVDPDVSNPAILLSL